MYITHFWCPCTLFSQYNIRIQCGHFALQIGYEFSIFLLHVQRASNHIHDPFFGIPVYEQYLHFSVQYRHLLRPFCIELYPRGFIVHNTECAVRMATNNLSGAPHPARIILYINMLLSSQWTACGVEPLRVATRNVRNKRTDIKRWAHARAQPVTNNLPGGEKMPHTHTHTWTHIPWPT